MKNHADRVTTACANAAHAMAKMHPVHAPRALNGTMVDRKHRSIALTKRDDLRPRLHARALLCDYEFAPGKVTFGLRQEDRDL